METALWCVLAAAILPILAVLPAKMSKDFNNARPRDPAYWSDPFRTRASWAQANGFEAFPLFAVSVIIGLWKGGDPLWIDKLALLFIGLRIIYTICYWTDRATPRSMAWAGALLCSIAIFTSPLWS